MKKLFPVHRALTEEERAVLSDFGEGEEANEAATRLFSYLAPQVYHEGRCAWGRAASLPLLETAQYRTASEPLRVIEPAPPATKRFVIGGEYRRGNEILRIAGLADTKACGICFVGEDDRGGLHPISTREEDAQHWVLVSPDIRKLDSPEFSI